MIEERSAESRIAVQAASTVLRVIGLWLALVVLFPLTVAAITSVALPPHPVELLALALLFGLAGAIMTRRILRAPR